MSLPVIAGETPHRLFSSATLTELLDTLASVGVKLPRAAVAGAAAFRSWQKDSAAIENELRYHQTPTDLFSMTRAEMIEHARMRANEEAGQYASLAHLGFGGHMSGHPGAAHFAVEKELAAALREILNANADALLDQIRPRFTTLATTAWDTVAMGIVPGMTAGQALALPGDATKIRKAWQSGTHNMAALAQLVDLRVQLSQVVGFPGTVRQDGILTWWPAFGDKPLLWGTAMDKSQVPPLDGERPYVRIPETAGQKVHRLTIEAGQPLQLLPIAKTNRILKKVINA